MRAPSSKLIHVLIGKSIAETLLVGALAVFAYANLFPPHFHGWHEVNERAITGWAIDSSRPWKRVDVQLFIDGRFFSAALASQSRPDVVAAGWARDEWHGYSFAVDTLPPGYHEATVYVLHGGFAGKRKSLQMIGEPRLFMVDGAGNLTRVTK